MKKRKKEGSFRFGTNRHSRIAEIPIRLLIVCDHFIDVLESVINIDVLLLLRLAVPTDLLAIIDFVDDVLSAKDRSWTKALKRQFGHLYVV